VLLSTVCACAPAARLAPKPAMARVEIIFFIVSLLLLRGFPASPIYPSPHTMKRLFFAFFQFFFERHTKTQL
jgi:hypothetical protein